MPLNPALTMYRREAVLIGRILMAYGELEYIICKSVAECRDKPYPILRALYRINGTTARLQAADALAHEIYDDFGMGPAFSDAIGALRICMSIRHQYAHCAWADGGRGRNGGLYFADPSTTARDSSGWEHNWRHINAQLLKLQYDYFEYSKDLLFHIETGASSWRRSQLPIFPVPPKRAPPKMHNPPERHIPQWISPTDQARHLERARAAKETVRSQQRARSGGKSPPNAKLSARELRDKKIRAALRKRRP